MSRNATSKNSGHSGAFLSRTSLLGLAFCLLTFLQLSVQGQLQFDAAYPDPEMATNALQLRRLISRPEALSCSARLEGVVLWTSPARDRLIIQDESGGVMVSMDLHGIPPIQPGQRVHLEGSCVAGRGGMSSQVLVDDDGKHAIEEKTGTIFLAPGLLPIRLEWYNGPNECALEVEWMGPQAPRQLISNAALFHREVDPSTGIGTLVQGLKYRCYEGEWERLPDFSALPIVTSGILTNFDLTVRTRETNVALVFEGCLKVPREGSYQFWIKSDDGAKLYIDNPQFRLSVLGTASLPAPHLISAEQLITEAQEYQRAEAEGIVTLVSELPDSVSLEVSSPKGRLYLRVMQGAAGSMELLLHSRIRATGICQTAFLFDGKAVPSLSVPNLNQIAIIEMASAYWVNYPILPIASVLKTNSPGSPVVHVSGTASSCSEKSWFIEDNGGRISVEGDQTPPAFGEHVELLGRRTFNGTNVVLQGSFYRKISPKVETDEDLLPLLTAVEQVKNLSGSEAQRGYPVKIRGVITSSLGDGVTIQDSSSSIFLRWKDWSNQAPFRIGDYWEIEGATFMGFAPNVYIFRTHCLGPGIMPEPLRPTWNELLNGSLDTKYIEIQGIVTAAQTNGLTLLTRDGRLEIKCYVSEPTVLSGLDNSLIRVRGVTSPVFDSAGQMSLARLPFYSPSVIVDEPAPLDPFAIPLKRVSDLFLFDPHADALRRVRIAGQVVGQYGGEYFLVDGNNGLRFRLKTPQDLRVGDLVEVVGFPNMAGPSPVLREALARRTGKDFLPAAKQLKETIPLSGRLDATLIRVVSRLVRVDENRSEKVLELQTGTRGFVARLKKDYGLLSDVAPGSRVELIGIYAGQGGDRAANRDIDSFELFLNSPLDITVLEQPSWWTIQHALKIMGAMVLVILISLVWITSLRRKVEQRSRQLTAEIQCREQSEKQRALEEERARIAQDLHDDLGAGLTQIRFLSAVESRDLLVPEETRTQLRQVSAKSNQMVTSLDEIVWAVNPANDSLPILGAYLCHVSEEFFRMTTVRCRLDVDDMLPSVPLTSEVRHNLYLAVREALNNIVKHSNATEAWLRIHSKEGVLYIVAEDNGCGFDEQAAASSGNGLSNMHRRLEKIGGRFECDSRPGGTTCRITLPLTEPK